MADDPVLISVDCEYTGQAVSNGELLSIGAVALVQTDEGFSMPPLGDYLVGQFSVNLRRVNYRQEAETMKWWENYPAQWIRATENPIPAMMAMGQFCEWVESFNRKAVFCAWPAAADWQYVNSYMWQYCNRNPFGYSPFCMKNYALGRLGKIGAILGHREDMGLPPEWEISPESLGLESHVAVNDAYAQGQSLCNMLNAR